MAHPIYRYLSPAALLALGLTSANAMASDTGTTEIQTRITTTVLQSTTENTRSLERGELDDQQVQQLDDLARYLPGLDMDNIGRFGSQGFVVRGLDGDRVAITVDGVSLGETLNPPSYAAYDFFASGRGGLDPDALKSVEVIKGADAITAGSGALGGAVAFVTKDPADYLQPEGDDSHLGVKLGYQSARDESAATLTLANRTGALESLLVYTGRRGHETESYYSGRRPDIPGTAREIPDPMDYDNHNLLAKLHYFVTPAHRLGTTLEGFRSASELDAQSRLNDSYLTRTSDDRVERRRLGLDYRWQTEQALFDELTWRYDFQRSYNRGHTLMTIPSGCPDGADTPAVSPCYRTEDRNFDQRLHKVLLHLDKDTGAHRLAYGVSGEVKELDFSHTLTRYLGTSDQVGEGWPQQGQELVPDTQVRSVSLYGRDQISLLDERVSVNLGARFDRFEYRPNLSDNYDDPTGSVGNVSFSAPGWQLGSAWRLTDSHQLWAQLGGGFRAPTAEDLYFFPSTTTATDVATGEEVELWTRVANPDLKAETSRTVELGYRWQRHTVALSASVFRNDYRNFIDYTTRVRNPDTEYESCVRGECSQFFGDEYQLPDNVDEALVEGVELDGQWLISRDWSLSLAYAWTQGEDSEGRPLESVSPATGTLGLHYASPDGRWGLGTRVVHSDGKRKKDTRQEGLNPFSRVPERYFEDYSSYTLVDLVGHLNLTANLRMDAGVYNLFDEAYIRWQRIRFVNEGAAAGGVRGGVSEDGIHRYTEPGRNVRVSLDYRF